MPIESHRSPPESRVPSQRASVEAWVIAVATIAYALRFLGLPVPIPLGFYLVFLALPILTFWSAVRWRKPGWLWGGAFAILALTIPLWAGGLATMYLKYKSRDSESDSSFAPASVPAQLDDVCLVGAI